VYKVLLDYDPEQGVEEEYKNKTNQLFSWRFLRQIAYIDIGNFNLKHKAEFKGDIDEQALLLYERAKKKEIAQPSQCLTD
jgi:hypothetical protein